VPISFDQARDFSEGLAAVKKGDRWGYIDLNGEFVIPPRFYGTAAGAFAEGLARAPIDGRLGYIDRSGAVFIPPQFDMAIEFSEGLARITLNGERGHIDREGRMAIAPKYEFASPFSEGLADVKLGEKKGYINRDGEFVIPPKFLQASSFHDGLAWVSTEDEVGYIRFARRVCLAGPVCRDAPRALEINCQEGDSMKPKKETAKSAKGFTEEERAAMKEYAQERKAAARRGSKASEADGEADVLASIAKMPEADRAMAERIHALIKATAPNLSPKTWYGMPAYAKDGNVVCFFQGGHKFKTRYSTIGFSDKAKLDEGTMWPSAFALKELTPDAEARIAALVKKEVG